MGPKNLNRLYVMPLAANSKCAITADDWIREADVHLGGDVVRYESRYLASVTCIGGAAIGEIKNFLI